MKRICVSWRINQILENDNKLANVKKNYQKIDEMLWILDSLRGLKCWSLWEFNHLIMLSEHFLLFQGVPWHHPLVPLVLIILQFYPLKWWNISINWIFESYVNDVWVYYCAGPDGLADREGFSRFGALGKPKQNIPSKGVRERQRSNSSSPNYF